MAVKITATGEAGKRNRHAELAARAHQEILVVEQYFFRFYRCLRQRKGHDRDTFSFFDSMSRTAIDDDMTRAWRARLDVGFESIATADRGNEYFFALPQIDHFHQIGGDFDAAFILYIRRRDHGAV